MYDLVVSGAVRPRWRGGCRFVKFIIQKKWQSINKRVVRANVIGVPMQRPCNVRNVCMTEIHDKWKQREKEKKRETARQLNQMSKSIALLHKSLDCFPPYIHSRLASHSAGIWRNFVVGKHTFHKDGV